MITTALISLSEVWITSVTLSFTYRSERIPTLHLDFPILTPKMSLKFPHFPLQCNSKTTKPSVILPHRFGRWPADWIRVRSYCSPRGELLCCVCGLGRFWPQRQSESFWLSGASLGIDTAGKTNAVQPRRKPTGFGCLTITAVNHLVSGIWRCNLSSTKVKQHR